jgi:hypothetical protein
MSRRWCHQLEAVVDEIVELQWPEHIPAGANCLFRVEGRSHFGVRPAGFLIGH